MSNEPKIIVVAGARGNLGKLVYEALLSRARADRQAVLVRGLARKTGAPPTSESPSDAGSQRLTIVPVDYESSDELRRACEGAYTVVSALQGHTDVIVGAQSRLLSAAIHAGARRFIPSDFSLDFTLLPEGANRNFDTRRAFHREAEALVRSSKSNIEITSIFQGAFTELLATGWMLVDYGKRRIGYFGSPDTVMEFTTTPDTAEVTAAAALDARATPKKLLVAGARLTPRQLQELVSRVTGVPFGLKRLMPLGMLDFVIKAMRLFRPGKKDELMPTWVGMQYAYCMAVGTASPQQLDNGRYPDIRWTSPDETVRKAFETKAVRS